MRTKNSKSKYFYPPSFSCLFFLWCHDVAHMNSISYSCFPLKQPSPPHVYSILPPLLFLIAAHFPRCGGEIAGHPSGEMKNAKEEKL